MAFTNLKAKYVFLESMQNVKFEYVFWYHTSISLKNISIIILLFYHSDINFF
jgi:hypothetical protein